MPNLPVYKDSQHYLFTCNRALEIWTQLGLKEEILKAVVEDLSGAICWETLHGKQKKFYAHIMIYPWSYIRTRGRVCLHTLVGRKRKHFDNAVDVVELLLALTDQAPNVRHLRVLHTFSSVTSLVFLIQQGVEEVDEFRRHDGMVTVMVK